MSDIDLSEFFVDPRRKSSCVVGDFLATLSAEDAEKANAALAHPEVATMAIFRWLKERGSTSNHSTVARHRKNECCCG
jgi:hypothetical protein